MMLSTPPSSRWLEINHLLPYAIFCARRTGATLKYSINWTTASFSRVNTSTNEQKASLNTARNMWRSLHRIGNVILSAAKNPHSPYNIRQAHADSSPSYLRAAARAQHDSRTALNL